MNFNYIEHFINEIKATEDLVKGVEDATKIAEDAVKVAEDATKLLAESEAKFAKATTDLEKTTAKTEIAAKQTALDLAKQEEAVKNLDLATKQKNTLNAVENDVDTLAKEGNKEVQNDIYSIMSRNPKKAAGAAIVAALGTYYLATVIKNYLANNNKKLTITNSYKSDTGPNDITIEFTPDTQIVNGDSVTFNSDTTFVSSLANVNVDVNKINSSTSITITSPYSITQYSNGGTMTLHTSMANQSIATAKKVGDTTGQIAGGTFSSFVDGTFNGLFGSYGQYILYGVIGLIVVFFIIFLIKMINKPSE